MRLEFIVGGIVVALLIIAALTFWPAADETAAPADAPATEEVDVPDPVPPAELPAAEETEPEGLLDAPAANVEAAEPAEVLPALAMSDDWVREAVGTWPVPERLLEREALLARLVVVLVNASEGGVPHREVASLVPAQSFRAREYDDDRYVLDPASYRRYDGYMDALEAVPPEALAGFMRRAEPLLIAALTQLGDERKPEVLVRSALARIDALPELPSRIELLRPEVMYLYADPALESLPAFEKQVLRIGPENLSRLERYLIDFSRHYF